MSKRLASLTVAVLVAGTAIFAALAQAQTTSGTVQDPAVTPAPTVTPTPEEVAATETRRKAEARAEARLAKKLRTKIRHHRKSANRWRAVMLKGPVRPRHRRLGKLHSSRLKPVLRHSRKVHRRARYRAKRPPHLRQWLCIHRHEGAWTAATGNGYYGGLQMDRTFMYMYGPKLYRHKGTANNWTPLEQIWVAERAAFRHGRGFYPWPNTARFCGLI